MGAASFTLVNQNSYWITDEHVRLVEEWTAAHLAWVASPEGSAEALAAHAVRARAYVRCHLAGLRVGRGTLPA